MKAAAVLLSAVLFAPGLFAAHPFTTNHWQTWTPRDEIAPRFSIDAKHGHDGASALKIETRGHGQFGAWQRTMDGIRGGTTYRFTAWFRSEDAADARRSVIARLQWLDGNGKAVRPPDYALDVAREGRWTKIEHVTPAPTNARMAQVQLSLGFADHAAVWWSGVELVEESGPANRVVRAMTVFHRPRGTKTAAESVEQFCRLVEGGATNRPDVVCLPEGITVVGTGKSYLDVSEPIPGPTTRRLGALAKKLKCYIVAGIYERTNRLIYNTAVLVGRDGALVGTYRKTHLPREEWEAGITAGDTYPVFATDFGRVGVMICWDLQFPEPCRAMALQGAQVVLVPIWGGSEVLARARAIENHVFLISSSYDMRTFIVSPAGAVLAEATADQPVAAADLHLDEKIFQPWLGDMSTRTWKERRGDIPVR